MQLEGQESQGIVEIQIDTKKWEKRVFVLASINQSKILEQKDPKQEMERCLNRQRDEEDEMV